jgi:hypothetical protein
MALLTRMIHWHHQNNITPRHPSIAHLLRVRRRRCGLCSWKSVVATSKHASIHLRPKELGRYLAIQVLLEHLRSRGLLSKTLTLVDSSSRMPLQAAQEMASRRSSLIKGHSTFPPQHLVNVEACIDYLPSSNVLFVFVMASNLSACSARVGCGSSLHLTTEVTYRATLIFSTLTLFLTVVHHPMLCL